MDATVKTVKKGKGKEGEKVKKADAPAAAASKDAPSEAPPAPAQAGPPPPTSSPMMVKGGVEAWLAKAAPKKDVDDEEEEDPDAADAAAEAAEGAEPQEGAEEKEPQGFAKGGGEGSRGGHIKGHTSSGKAVYEGKAAAPPGKGPQDSGKSHELMGAAQQAQEGVFKHGMKPGKDKMLAGRDKASLAFAQHHAENPHEAIGKTPGGHPIQMGMDHKTLSAADHKVAHETLASASQHMTALSNKLTGEKAAQAHEHAAKLGKEAMEHFKARPEKERKEATQRAFKATEKIKTFGGPSPDRVTAHRQAAQAHLEASKHGGELASMHMEHAADHIEQGKQDHAVVEKYPMATRGKIVDNDIFRKDPETSKSEASMSGGVEQWLKKAGIPGAEDVAGGKGPADDLPDGVPEELPLDKQINGGFSQAGAEGGDLEPGAGTGARVENDGPGKDNDVEDTTGKVGNGDAQRLSKDDPPQGRMDSGEPGMNAEEGAGLSGSDQMDVGKMKKGDLDHVRVVTTLDHDAQRRHAIAIQKAQVPNGQDILIVGWKTQAVPEDQVVKAQLPADASDRAVDLLFRSTDENFYRGGSAPSMDVTGSIGKAHLCKSCGDMSPAYLSSCQSCGVGMTAASVQTPKGAGGMAKSEVRIERPGPGNDLHLLLPQG